jgi:excisionase family DNA binding protein
MPKRNGLRIDEDRSYTVQEAAPLLELTAETLKKKCREGEINGIQKGTKKKWHLRGSEILRLKKRWNLD